MSDELVCSIGASPSTARPPGGAGPAITPAPSDGARYPTLEAGSGSPAQVARIERTSGLIQAGVLASMPNACNRTVGSDGRSPESTTNGVVEVLIVLTSAAGMTDTRSLVELASASGVQLTR